MRGHTLALALAATVVLGLGAGAAPTRSLAGPGAASFAGRVLDPLCGVMPGVSVTLRDTVSATERQVATDADGRFAFDNLANARYALRVRLAGFRTLLRDDVGGADGVAPVTLILPVSGLVEAMQVVRSERNVLVPPVTPAAGILKVIDEACATVPGALVTLRTGETTWTPATNASGEIDLSTYRPGQYVVSIHAPGYVGTVLRGLALPLRYSQGITLPLRHGRSGTPDVFDDTMTNPPAHPRIRIAAMGDSTTAGTPAFKSPREAPPDGSGDETSQYAYWLMKSHPEWQVINQGVNAQRSDTIAARFDTDVVKLDPDVVVIIAGVNDVYQGRPAQQVKDQLADMYRRAHAARIRVVGGTIIPYNTATPDQNARMHEVNAWIRAQADAGIVTFVDTRAAVASPDSPDLLVSSPDGLHPDADGYRRMAEAIGPAIERAMAKR